MSESPEGCAFQFDGRTIHAAAGQTVAGALFGEGTYVLSRSFKYHRPRGLFCVSGRCPNCLCNVNGVPNVRICTTPAQSDMIVQTQNAWPSVRFDILSVLKWLEKFMPVGFYYKRMYKPRWMWPIWEKMIRRIAGLGKVDRASGGEGKYDKLNLFADVAVVGGGCAGLHAAFAAAEAGLSVTLIDDQPALGGHLRHDPDLARSGSNSELELLDKIIRQTTEHPRIQVINSATAFGLYDDNYLAVQRDQRLIRLRAAQVIIATGGWERPLVFENNDVPGILLASGAQRLMHLEKCRLEGTAVVVTDNAQGHRVARQLAAAGTRVAAIADVRENPPDPFSGAELFRGHTLLRACGVNHVEAAVLAPVAGGATHEIECQWIIEAVGFTPANALLYQNGCQLTHDPAHDHAAVTRFARATHAAGSVVGMHDPRTAILAGRQAGLAAAIALRPEAGHLADELRELDAQLTARATVNAAATAHYVSASTAKRKFVCLCEDVTEKDVCDAIAEGYSNIETLKRYSTVSMGPCQGKMCQGSAIAICARQNGVSIAQTGVTTARPPEQPVSLGALAGRALHLNLVRQTPLHDWHIRAGATMLDAGAWKRPQVYTTAAREYEAVRKQAGIIDVSTLGKIELRGRDVVRFLEFIYPNRFENLKIGRVRYGVICDEAGIILDDGTISRLEENRFFLTTTTGNADAIDSWFRSWLVTRPHWDVQMANVSGSYAAMNLAGPRSRQILKKLTSTDVSSTALPYLSAARIHVAGIPAIVLRIGFVGELGYEIHVPTHYGLAAWTAIVETGQHLGLEPFGIEAQRLLRLEKKHLLPGVDTDALSNPYEADLPWIVRLEKTDFIGKHSLARIHDRPARNRLVGFRVVDGPAPEPAALVIHQGKLGGRVTSSGYSPTVGATIGLAWVPAEQSANGDRIEIRVDDRTVTAVVQEEPFYDPAGDRLKS